MIVWILLAFLSIIIIFFFGQFTMKADFFIDYFTELFDRFFKKKENKIYIPRTPPNRQPTPTSEHKNSRQSPANEKVQSTFSLFQKSKLQFPKQQQQLDNTPRFYVKTVKENALPDTNSNFHGQSQLSQNSPIFREMSPTKETVRRNSGFSYSQTFFDEEITESGYAFRNKNNTHTTNQSPVNSFLGQKGQSLGNEGKSEKPPSKMSRHERANRNKREAGFKNDDDDDDNSQFGNQNRNHRDQPRNQNNSRNNNRNNFQNNNNNNQNSNRNNNQNGNQNNNQNGNQNNNQNGNQNNNQNGNQFNFRNRNNNSKNQNPNNQMNINKRNNNDNDNKNSNNNNAFDFYNRQNVNNRNQPTISGNSGFYPSANKPQVQMNPPSNRNQPQVFSQKGVFY
ncbi:hypothetical protein TRFO_40393 [Tritrichomonas foetus]|uniref:Uncharacterized protein n=1 Tax=Tritrichomonas foetus TaxID=1144522 RepID=A0A1J4J3L1_9EUKA|nr:hypothetical protein TRFO_40393 [Tritrichomonas foetus]|eukprot:OHS93329.1 hypothetical protein TRFO_40393 [Tritrichomonas foetus]